MDVSDAVFQFTRRCHSASDVVRASARALQYGWLQTRPEGACITVPFGAASFRMRIQATGARAGSRAIYIFREQYEPLLQFGAALLSPGDAALDLGANQGIFCCAFAAAVGPQGKVAAAEPIPRQVERLRANIELNGFTNCVVVPKAVSDSNGRTRLSIGTGDTAASIVHIDDTSTFIEVDTITVDRMVSDLGLDRLALVKMDLEGAEMMGLRGAVATLETLRPALAMEVATPDQLAELRGFLQPLDYAVHTYDRTGALAPLEAFSGLEDNVIALPKGHPLTP